jgi:hypothetical protein
MARVVRADVQSIKTSDFVAAARALGAMPRRILERHVLPATFPAVSVAMTIAVGRGFFSRARSASSVSASSRRRRVGETCSTRRRRR